MPPMPPSRLPGLSKSTFLMGLQCQKLLWFRYNAQDQIPAPDEATQALFDQGTEVGVLAHQLFPGGIAVAPGIITPNEVIAETQKAIRKRRPLYEAAFAFRGGYARADILVPFTGNAWDLVEVKSTTQLKEEVHLPDLAFQAFVLTGAGIELRKCFLAHINNEFVRHGQPGIPANQLRPGQRRRAPPCAPGFGGLLRSRHARHDSNRGPAQTPGLTHLGFLNTPCSWLALSFHTSSTRGRRSGDSSPT
jgi:hypothetical protein